ncbi:MAG: protein-disulfide reductase DsbD family protein, partial [Porticoccaceae bacterium]|nr:protein-disulfide reductase DsbD family protein [Porticoccaceae bacterium]
PDASWHNYWMNPGEAGKEMKVRWKDLPEGVEVSEFTYETPHLASMGGIVTYGYSGPNTITMDVTVPDSYGEDSITLGGKASYLVCDDANCVPQSVPVSITLPVGNGDLDAANADAFKAARDHQPQVVDWDGQFSADEGLTQVSFAVQFPEQGASDIYIWPSVKKMIEHTMSQETQIDDGVLKATLQAGKRLKKYDQVDLMITYTDASGAKQAKFVTGVEKASDGAALTVAAVPSGDNGAGGAGSGGED